MIHLDAVFSPTPGMPGRLSLGSPRSAAKSGYCVGVRPYFSTTASGVKRVSSLTPLMRVQHRHVVADQLQRVAVTGDHQHPVALVLGLGGQRRDDVVGLEARLGEHRDAQRAKDFLGDVDLTAELVGRRGPVGLVLRVALGAERLPRHVERRGDVRRRLVAQQVDQHRGEAVDRVGGQPAAGS